jgi:hypothetical protein
MKRYAVKKISECAAKWKRLEIPAVGCCNSECVSTRGFSEWLKADEIISSNNP